MASSNKDDKPTNWAELPSKLTYSILLRLNPVEILDSAQRVCTSWRRVSKDPSMWRKIDMRGLRNHRILCSFCRLAIERSEGCLVDINFGNIGSDSLLNYAAERSSHLRSLTVAMPFRMSNEGLVNAVAKLPMLEELEVSHLWSRLNLKDIGYSCPRLKTLKLNCSGYRFSLSERDDDAIAIAESMPEISHLQLIANRLTDTGLNAILDNCPHLQHLDLRKCFNVGDLEKQCSERIKVLRRPYDSTDDDFPFGTTFVDETDTDEEEDDFYNDECGYDYYDDDYDPHRRSI